MSTAFLYSPILHCVGYYVRNVNIKRIAVGNSLFKSLEGILGKPFFHNSFIKNIAAENLRYIHKNFLLYIISSHCPFRINAPAFTCRYRL